MKLKILQVREPSADDYAHSSRDVARLMHEEAKADRECFWVLHLDSANRIIEKELVSMGTVSCSIVHPREVFKKAILNGASRIITVHNHPSGRMDPSEEDRNLWARLDEAGKLLGIMVLDHLVVGPSGEYYSSEAGTG